MAIDAKEIFPDEEERMQVRAWIHEVNGKLTMVAIEEVYVIYIV
jgi:hypothetical protein